MVVNAPETASELRSAADTVDANCGAGTPEAQAARDAAANLEQVVDQYRKGKMTGGWVVNAQEDADEALAAANAKAESCILPEEAREPKGPDDIRKAPFPKDPVPRHSETLWDWSSP